MKTEENKILIIEDEKPIYTLIKERLNEDGFNDIEITSNIKDSFIILSKIIPDIIILDINLPDGNGMEILQYLKKNKEFINISVLVLTAIDDFKTKKDFFDKGIDAYLTKPIDYRELTLWINSFKDKKTNINKEIIKDGDLEININLEIIKYKNKEIENITKREFDLFIALILNSPKYFSRQEIIKKIFKTCSVENLVDIHLHNLRNKLPIEISKKIQAFHGRGFRYIKS